MDTTSIYTDIPHEVPEQAAGSGRSPETGRCPFPGKKANIISRRETEPLLAKARQVLTYYNEAISCQAAVLDKNGFTASPVKSKLEMYFCKFCKKYFSNTSQAQVKPASGKRSEHPCEMKHYEAQTESRRIEETFIYTCELGLIYWTSPLYRNGRYAGALAAGQVLSGDPEMMIKKFRAGCNGSLTAEKIRKTLESVPQKSHAEIQAMARMLAVCAEKISEKEEDPGEMIRHSGWLEEFPKISGQPGISRQNKIRLAASAQTHTNKQEEWTDDSEYPLEKERMLLAAFRRGDNDTGGRILNELMDSIRYTIPHNFDIVRFRAIELAVLLSRAAADTENSNSDSMFETNNRYLRRLLESKTPEELIENLHLVTKRISGNIFSFQGIRHASVLRKAERYIWEHYTRKISLEEISRASGLSAPYFSTIFKEEMGENLSSYINRLRVEKAATLLTETGRPLNEIAELCGFEDQSWFSKIFKNFTHISPGKYRETGSRPLDWKPGRIRSNRGIIFPELPNTEQNEQDLLSS